MTIETTRQQRLRADRTQIIKCPEQVSTLTGQRPYRVFENWLYLVEVTFLTSLNIFSW